jgi:tyrosyl-tRNA synthetase
MDYIVMTNPLLKRQMAGLMDMAAMEAYLEAAGTNPDEFSEQMQRMTDAEMEAFLKSYTVFYKEFVSKSAEHILKSGN